MPGASRALLVSVLLSAPSIVHAEPPASPPHPSAPEAPPSVAPLVTARFASGVLAAAFRMAGFPAAQRFADDLVTRARLSALLPDLSVRVARSTDQSLRFSPTADDPYRYSEGGGVGLWLEARATWRLDGLLFHRDELSVQRLRIERADAAARLQKRVLELLFDWEKAELGAADPEAPPEDRRAAALRASVARVTLDVLTGGWFSDQRGAGSRRGQKDSRAP